jgi:hypothetical protein
MPEAMNRLRAETAANYLLGSDNDSDAWSPVGVASSNRKFHVSLVTSLGFLVSYFR